MNQLLTQAFTEEEVNKALHQMHPTSAPGPDGMAPIFYQSYWKTIGISVSSIVMKALNTGIFPSSLNHTFVTLIPKKKSPENVANYHPISLCNVTYKLIAKVLASRLKLVLPHIISDS